MKANLPIPFLFFIALLSSCNTNSESRNSPHKKYASKIIASGLDQTSMGRRWLIAANECLMKPQWVRIPYSESGYFAIDTPSAFAFRFSCKRGQKIIIKMDVRSSNGLRLFGDLYQYSSANVPPEWIEATDTLKREIQYDIEESGDYGLRIQPELLGSGSYELNVSYSPSLAFPLRKGKIESVWGDVRDGGARKHEGIDIFAPKYSPVLAAADGSISRVNENNLGGNVVWEKVHGRSYQLYYAHLDKQLVREGQDVKIGDTVGLVGNTGNARTTPAHLHFGIYTWGGAIDPLPFVDPNAPKASPITASSDLIGTNARTTEPTRIYGGPNIDAGSVQIDKGAFLRIQAATAEWYRVATGTGAVGYISSASVTVANKPITQLVIKKQEPLFDNADTSAAIKEMIAKGEAVDVLSTANHFYYVRSKEKTLGWIHEQ